MPPKNRIVRVRELIQRELSSIIVRDYNFPGVLLTVNDLDITPDLKQAHVYIGIIGRPEESERIVERLNKDRADIQHKLSRRVILKNTAQLHFKLDHSVERGVRITQIMDVIDGQLAASAAREALEPAAPVNALEADIDEEEEDLDADESDDEADVEDDTQGSEEGPRRPGFRSPGSRGLRERRNS